jgi:hypothetical protein
MASRTQAADLINELWSYFRTTEPPEKSVEVWINDLIDIDLNSAGYFIINKIKHLDKFPNNFPGTVKSFYFQWRREQPKEKSELGCSKCINGLLHASKEGYSFAFRCGHCDSSMASYPTATKYQIEEQGYELDWQHDYDGPIDPKFMGKIKGLLKTPVIRQESELEEIPF